LAGTRTSSARGISGLRRSTVSRYLAARGGVLAEGTRGPAFVRNVSEFDEVDRVEGRVSSCLIVIAHDSSSERQ
jgi:hypothetical protein